MAPTPTKLSGGIDFGEGPRWHQGRFWYSDFYQGTVSAVDLNGTREVVVSIDDRPSGLGWLPNGDLLIVSMTARKVLRYDGSILTEHADLGSIATFHCNDMVVSTTGYAYVGNFGFDIESGPADPVPATLAVIAPDGTVSAGPDDLLFPNGSVITPDGATLIIGETFGSQYRAFDLNGDGSVGAGRVWAETPLMAPDGCTLDAAGGIWFADAVGSQVVRIVEGGEITDTITFEQPTFACTLGGETGTTLAVLTAVGASPAEAAGSGGGFLWTVPVDHPKAGLP